MKHEILGIMVDNIIYTGKEALERAKILGRFDKLITYETARFMACCDLGHQWDRLAKASIIMIIEDDIPRQPTLKDLQQSRHSNGYYVPNKLLEQS